MRGRVFGRDQRIEESVVILSRTTVALVLTLTACVDGGGSTIAADRSMTWITWDGKETQVEKMFDGRWNLQGFPNPLFLDFGQEFEVALPCVTSRVAVAEFGTNARVPNEFSRFKSRFAGGDDAYSIQTPDGFSQEVGGGVRFFDLPKPTGSIRVKALRRTSEDDGTRPNGRPMEYRAEIAAIGAKC